jgi:hypothetical protein
VTTYNPTLHPNFRPADFDYPEDMLLKQLDIRDVDGSLVRPWKLQETLVEGAFISAVATIVVWVVDDHAVSRPVTVLAVWALCIYATQYSCLFACRCII